jgi:adenylate cyclase
MLTLVPAGIILSITLVSLNEFVQKDVQQTSRLIGRQTLEYVTSYVSIPFRISEELRFINARNVYKMDDLETGKTIMFPLMSRNPEVSYVYYGSEDGSFAGYTIGTTTKYSYTASVNGSFFAVDVISNDTGVTAPIDPASVSAFDLFTQEWYTASRATYVPKWLGPYFIPFNVYNDPKSIYLSAMSPWYNESSPRKEVLGVSGCDIIISKMNDFLKSVSISENSAVYVIENDGVLMVSGSNVHDSYFNISSDYSTMNRLKMRQSSIPNIATLGSVLENEYGSKWKQGQVKSKSYIINGVSYYLEPLAFSDNYSLDWTILVIIAQSDFTGLTDQFRNTILITDCIVIVVSIAFGLILAYAITRPLIRLGNEMEKLRNMQELIPTSPNKLGNLKLFHEVRVLDSHFSNLEKAVQGFMKFVPKEIVMDFLTEEQNGGDLFKPFVSEKKVAILFSDIESFTSISENLHPRQLISMLNVYFEEASNVIRSHQGTLDKYIGDSIMAFWNAPHDLEKYETQACRAAIEMQRVIGDLNERFSNDGLPPFNTRIGVHVGNVLVGNTGSSFRLSYTIMGDSVNLGSRLEGLNKMYGTRILISHDCKVQVDSVMTTRLVDKVAVKGKKKGVKVYELVGENVTEEASAWAQRYTDVMSAYFRKDFGVAQVKFQEYLINHPNDKSCLQMIERCKKYLQNPPDETWTGIEVMNEK